MLLGEIAGLANAILWAGMSVILGSLAGRLSAIRVNAIQLIFGSLFYALLIPLAGGHSLFADVTLRRGLALAGTALLTMGAGDSLYFAGISRIGASRASPISVSSFPMLTLVLGALLLGEHVTWSVVAGAALIIGGIAVLVSRSPSDTTLKAASIRRAVQPIPTRSPEVGEQPEADTAISIASAARRPHEGAIDPRGVLLVLGAALCWSAATLWLRVVTPGLPAIAVTSIRVPSAALFLLVVGRARGLVSLEGIQRRTWLLLLGTGVLGTGLGSLSFTIAIQRTGAGLTALLTSTSPLWVLPMAAVFLHERLTRRVILGSALALVGIWLVVL